MLILHILVAIKVFESAESISALKTTISPKPKLQSVTISPDCRLWQYKTGKYQNNKTSYITQKRNQYRLLNQIVVIENWKYV